ncbi:MAG: 3' terminal RNA ribose 2'-O-methyltransferase Hen1, partial [Myxococcota bacterium]
STDIDRQRESSPFAAARSPDGRDALRPASGAPRPRWPGPARPSTRAIHRPGLWCMLPWFACRQPPWHGAKTRDETTMLLSITTTHQPATDLGYLLAKHPDKCQSFGLTYGQAHVFYPRADDDECTACLLLDIDPSGLVRGRERGQSKRLGTLAHYVSDQPYVASSFLSVAIAQVYSSALHGTCTDRPELAETAIPLRAELSVVPCRDGQSLLGRLFEPLGYAITAERLPLDEAFPDWGDGPYFRVSLSKTAPLSELLAHLYVLLPVLDNAKHYWVGRDELEKLLAHGESWLADHPAREEIANRHLKHQRRPAREAIERLMADQDVDPDGADDEREREKQAVESGLSLNEQRLDAVVAALKEAGARRVIDLGCGEGRLLGRLLHDSEFTAVAGVDVSTRALDFAAQRLELDQMPDHQRERLELFQSSLTYRDDRFAGYDAACAVEVVEHIEPSRLRAFERVLFEFARPRTAIIITPNAEYNVRFSNLPDGRLRHRDHRFEWTRQEFEAWAGRIAEQHGYTVRFVPIGPGDDEVGAPTQMGVFSR